MEFFLLIIYCCYVIPFCNNILLTPPFYFQSWISETVVADFQDDFLVDREAPVTRYPSL